VVLNNLLLIWVSYSVNNHHVVAVVLQEASLKMGPYLSLKCVMFQYVRWRKSEKCESSNVIQPLWEPCRMVWLFCIPCTVQTWLHSFFGNLSWHWREGDVVTAAQFKNSLLLYAVKQCRSQYGCWSATSIETSVYDVIYMHLECSWTWWPYKERSLLMWEHMKHYLSCQNTQSWTHCYVDGSAPCWNPGSGDPALWETEELNVWRLLQWKEALLLLMDGQYCYPDIWGVPRWYQQ